MTTVELQKALGYSFNNEQLLINALTHSSYANERQLHYDNERLEFLGDSVLGLITAEYLYESFGKRQEGELTKQRALLVCEGSLFGFAEQIGLGSYILLGNGEENTGGRERPSLLADAFEAVIAAIYLDGGIEPARKFVLSFISAAVSRKIVSEDYKTMLQEKVQSVRGNTIRYELTDESGPAHAKVFTSAVILNGRIVGEGSGKSKKEAEQQAAKAALKAIE